MFDLAVVSFIKCVLHHVLIYYAEEFYISTMNPSVRVKRLLMIIRLVSLASTVFSLVKGSLVLEQFINNENYSGMHSTYYGCLIWTIVSDLIILILSLALGPALRRLAALRTTKYFNSAGEQVDKEGKTIPKEASLIRLLGLARPVSLIVHISHQL